MLRRPRQSKQETSRLLIRVSIIFTSWIIREECLVHMKLIRARFAPFWEVPMYHGYSIRLLRTSMDLEILSIEYARIWGANQLCAQ